MSRGKNEANHPNRQVGRERWNTTTLPSGHTQHTRSCGHCGGDGSDPFEASGECQSCGGSGTERKFS